MNAHTHSHLKKKKKRTKKKKSSGRSYENYYFHVVDDRLEKNSSKHSVFAKASTSILKLSIRGRCGGWSSPLGSFGCQTTLWFKLWVNWSDKTKVATFRKSVSNLQTEVENYFTIWLFASSFFSFLSLSSVCWNVLLIQSPSLGVRRVW